MSVQYILENVKTKVRIIFTGPKSNRPKGWRVVTKLTHPYSHPHPHGGASNGRS